MNPVDSGGSLVDTEGRVIGVTTGRVQRPWLGVAGKFITQQIRELFVLPFTEGMLVETVAVDSPASQAGLLGGDTDVVVSGQPWMMGGDIIVAIKGTPVQAVQDFLMVLKQLRIEETVDVEFLRDRERQTVFLTVSERPHGPLALSIRSSDLRSRYGSIRAYLEGRHSEPVWLNTPPLPGTRTKGWTTDDRLRRGHALRDETNFSSDRFLPR